MIKIKKSSIKSISFKNLNVGDIFSVGEDIEAVPFQEVFMRIKPDPKNTYNAINLNSIKFCNFSPKDNIYFFTNSEMEFLKNTIGSEHGPESLVNYVYIGFISDIKTFKKTKFNKLKIGDFFSFSKNKRDNKSISQAAMKISDFSFLNCNDGEVTDFSRIKLELKRLYKFDVYKLDVTFEFRLR